FRPASSHSTTGSARPPTSSKTSLTTAKPATPKTSSSTLKPATTKTTSATPSGGKPPASQSSRNTTPVKKGKKKKRGAQAFSTIELSSVTSLLNYTLCYVFHPDVTKPATPAPKKPAESVLTRPSPAIKSAKPETPKSSSKSEVPTKKPTASKAADTKTPNWSKTQDSKTPSKDASKISIKKVATKTSSPKKAVGSSTPTPVKRGPKDAKVIEPEKEIAAAVAAAAAIATVTAAIAGPEEPEASAEAPTELSTVPEQMLGKEETVQEPTPEPVSVPMLEEVREPTPEPVREPTPELIREPISELTPEPIREQTPEHVQELTIEHPISPHEKEDTVEKADEEINEDNDDDENEDQRRIGHQPSSTFTDVSRSQPCEELQVRSSAFGGSAGWHCDDLMSGMDSEDVSSCTSSRQQGVSDISSTQHTAILEGTQSSDALVDSSLRGSEGDGNLMGSPNVETLANEEEDDDDEERVDDMDLSSERVDEHHEVFQQQKQDGDEDVEDVEMHSEGVTESCENADEDDFNEEEHIDNLSCSGLPLCEPPTSSWGQTNPFCDPWAQPASQLFVSSPSPISDHGLVESEIPTISPAQTHLDSCSPSFATQSEEQPKRRESAHEEIKSSDVEEAHNLLAAPAVGFSQPSTLSGTALAVHSSSETSTPEDLCDYDSSSGVESRSDKQQTPVPASVHLEIEQDLGIHLEKGDREEEEAETLPPDEVLGTGPPTAPASVPSSPSTSGDEASDTEGEMQINDPDAPGMMDESAGPTPTCSLPALEEDVEAVDIRVGEGEEDGGGATPQSANSVASYAFDCTTSNSNAHSVAESCGKSPGIFSLENEEQLPEEAKDPSLIKELTLSSTAVAAQAEDLLGRNVDLMPLGHPGENEPGLEEHHYVLGNKIAADHPEGDDPLEPSLQNEAQESGESSDSQSPYHSTICDKTDSFLAGNPNCASGFQIIHSGTLQLMPVDFSPDETNFDRRIGGEQLWRLEQQQEKLGEMQHHQKQDRKKRQWLEEERLRLEQQKQLEKQRRELLQLQLQQQQQEHRHHRQVLQWQLELEQQYRMQQYRMQQKSPTGVMLSPSSGLCTIYEAMETSDEEDEFQREHNMNVQVVGKRVLSSQSFTQDFQRQLRPVPPQELGWNKKVDMVQQLINQTLMLSGDRGCPPLLLLPVGTGGTLSPLESNMWPSLLPQFSPPAATVTSVSSYSPESQGSSPSGDWTVVEVETQH
uniref:BTB/POZ domain-containing protein n=1 Tax=Mola mola TaxID=94237 RepID=A0A3Q3W2D2_MOLML